MAPCKKDDNGVILDDAELRKLAKLLLRQEEPQLKSIKNEFERTKYVKQCNDVYEDVLRVLDCTNSFHEKYDKESNVDKAGIAKEISDYIKYGINMSLQCIRNCFLRESFIEKIKTHFNSLAADLEKVDPNKVEPFAKDVSLYKQCMWEYTNKCQSSAARAISNNYSQSLKNDGIKFADLVDRNKNKLGLNGEFESLEYAQKLQVYNSIIEESGRAKDRKIELANNATPGFSLLLSAAGLMVLDIFTAGHDMESVVSRGLSPISEMDGFSVQVPVEESIITAETNKDAGVFSVSLTGFAMGTVLGLLMVDVSGSLIDQIFGSGGKVALNLDGLKFHTANMPDGMSLAYQVLNVGA